MTNFKTLQSFVPRGPKLQIYGKHELTDSIRYMQSTHLQCSAIQIEGFTFSELIGCVTRGSLSQLFGCYFGCKKNVIKMVWNIER